MVILSGAAHGANNNKLSSTEMDSHANTALVGSNATKIQYTGRYADVNAFANDVRQMKRVTIKDMEIAYDCQYQKKKFLLIIKNALHVPSMNHNLIPSFILDEAGLEVDTKPKIYSKNLSVDSHSIFDTATELRITLKPRGLFYYFYSIYLNSEEIHDCKLYDTIYLTPDFSSWNPTNTSWAEQEDSLLDSDGNIPFTLVRESHNLISDDDTEICSCKVLEQPIDDVLISSCSRNPQGGDNYGQE